MVHGGFLVLFQKHYQATQPTCLLYSLPNTGVCCSTYCRVPESRQNSAAVGSGTSRGTPPLAQTSAARWHSKHVCRQSPTARSKSFPARSKSFPKARLALEGLTTLVSLHLSPLLALHLLLMAFLVSSLLLSPLLVFTSGVFPCGGVPPGVCGV